MRRILLWLLLIGLAACASDPLSPAAAPAVSPPLAVQVNTPTAVPSPHPPSPTASPPTATPHPTATPPPTATAVPLTLSNPQNPALAELAAASGVPFIRHEEANTGIVQYPARSFLHPIALTMRGDVAYLLDGGRVLALNLAQSGRVQILLAPDDRVGDVPVVEPLDLHAAADGLLVLDRVGDVYRLPWGEDEWELDRYDRPVGESSGHYYVALADGGNGRYLLETGYRYVHRYGANRRDRLWNLPQSRAVAVAAQQEDVYVLTQSTRAITGTLALYRQTARIGSFAPPVEIERPRMVVVAETAVYLLDQGGARLLVLDAATGELRAVHQPPGAVGAVSVGKDGQLIFAATDRLYLAQRPALRATVTGGPTLAGPQPHDPALLAALPRLVVPIGGSDLTQRALQMPGAPRHYRLGVHQGVDFYWRRGTAVRAVADGVVIRATHDYEPPSPQHFDDYRAEVQRLGTTPTHLQDVYRGRQVWIEHDDGLVSRYAHLSAIYSQIVVGTAVVQGQPLGEIGNSGSPASLDGETADAHLHFELWVGDDAYLGQFLRPIETREWLTQLLFNR